MKRMVFALLTLALILSAGLAQASCDHPWVVGVYDHPPFQGFDKNGAPSGIEVDLIRQVANQMQCQVLFKNIPWQRQLNYAKTGEVDIVMGAGIRQDRKEYLYFFGPYIYEPSVFVMLAPRRAQIPIHSLDDVTKMGKAFKVAALIGASYSQAYAEWIKSPAAMRHVDMVYSDEISLKLLLAQRVDVALFADPHEPYEVLRKMNLKADIVVFPIDIASNDDNYAYFTYSKKKFTESEARAVNDMIVATIKSKSFAGTVRKYFNSNEIKVLLYSVGPGQTPAR